MNQGIYEELVTQLVSQKLANLNKNHFFINTAILDKVEASSILSNHLAQTIKKALNYVKGENQIETQIEIANKIIVFLKDELKNEEFNNDLIVIQGEILKAVFSRLDAHFSDLNLHLKEITPYTRLTHSELFTGGNVGLSLESELKKEILSSNSIDLLVSFTYFLLCLLCDTNIGQNEARTHDLWLSLSDTFLHSKRRSFTPFYISNADPCGRHL